MRGEVTGIAQITCVLAEVPSIECELNVPEIVYADSNPYDGEYEFTPTDHKQIVPIRGKTAIQDIVINSIPSNYGLITWNGSTLTVS